MIYAIQYGRDGPIKIGFAVNPPARVADLQTGTPVELRLVAECEGDRLLEKHIHRVLKGIRIRGEWFSPIGNLIGEVVRAMREGGIGVIDLEGKEPSGLGPTQNRRTREAYNAYQRDLMRKRRAAAKVAA